MIKNKTGAQESIPKVSVSVAELFKMQSRIEEGTLKVKLAAGIPREFVHNYTSFQGDGGYSTDAIYTVWTVQHEPLDYDFDNTWDYLPGDPKEMFYSVELETEQNGKPVVLEITLNDSFDEKIFLLQT